MVFHTQAVPDEAVIVEELPAHTFDGTATTFADGTLTTTVIEALAVQTLVAVTVYAVVVLGVTYIVSFVCPLFQL